MTDAKPIPWNRPNTKITTHRLSLNFRKMLFSPTSTMDSAINDSTMRGLSSTIFNAARLRVIECESVKIVTIFRTFQRALPKVSTGMRRDGCKRR